MINFSSFIEFDNVRLLSVSSYFQVVASLQFFYWAFLDTEFSFHKIVGRNYGKHYKLSNLKSFIICTLNWKMKINLSCAAWGNKTYSVEVASLPFEQGESIRPCLIFSNSITSTSTDNQCLIGSLWGLDYYGQGQHRLVVVDLALMVEASPKKGYKRILKI